MAISAGTAPAPASRPSLLVRGEAGTLATGSYLWDPLVALSGPISMIVDLTTQRAFVYRDGKLIGISTVSSGRPGYETPTGTYIVTEKDRFHHSNKYDNAPMPYMQRLSDSGLALHAGSVRPYPASHGCIRLPSGFAAALFKEETRGMAVVITGHTPSREELRLALRDRTRGNCCEAEDSEETERLNATQYWSGQVNTDSPPAPAPCCETGAGAASSISPVAPAIQPTSPRCAAGDDDCSGDSTSQDNSAAPTPEFFP